MSTVPDDWTEFALTGLAKVAAARDLLSGVLQGRWPGRSQDLDDIAGLVKAGARDTAIAERLAT